jgi:ketosteroid isomerase-like protein
VSDEPTTLTPLEALRRSIEAFSRRDLDSALTTYAENAVWDWSNVGLGIYGGREAIRGLYEDFWDSYADIEQLLEEFRDLGDGVFFGVVDIRGRPVGSSAFVELRYGAVVLWMDGLIHRIVTYGGDIDEARAAAERLAEERGQAVSNSSGPDAGEKFRDVTAALNRRDVDAVLSMYSPCAVMDLSPQGLGVFEGREAIRSLVEEWVQLYEDYRADLEELRDLGNGVTFSVVLHSGRPAGSSGLVEVRHAYTAIWTDGLIEQQTHYAEVETARAAAERLAEERG